METVDQLFAVEETSPSPQSETVVESTPETSMIPNAEQQSVLDLIRDASRSAQGFELQQGKVVVKKAAAEPTEPAQAQQPVTEFEELTVNGEAVRVPKSELKNLAQQGYRFTQKTQELAAKSRELDEQLLAIQSMQQQPQQRTAEITEPASDDDLIAKAMDTVKQQFGKDDPDFEFDPLDYKQIGAYNSALFKLQAQEAATAQQREAAVRTEAERQQRMNGWENSQRAIDPEYDNVVAWAVEKVETGGVQMPRLKQILSAAQFEVADKAFSTGDTQSLGKIITYVKKAYQQQKLGLPTRSTAPPLVQSPGTGEVRVQSHGKRDASQLAGMSQEQRVAWIKNNLTK